MSVDLAPLFATATPPDLRMTQRPGCASIAEVDALAGKTLAGVDGERAALITSLAHCWHDHFDACHELCQAREGQQDADYVHAILHRREGDVSNARYWFRRVGAHPCFAAVGAAAKRLGLEALCEGGTAIDAGAFIAASVKPAGREAALIDLQAEEIRGFARFLLGD